MLHPFKLEKERREHRRFNLTLRKDKDTLRIQVVTHVKKSYDLQCSASCRWVGGATSPSVCAKNAEAGVYVNSHFDSGNIEVGEHTA